MIGSHKFSRWLKGRVSCSLVCVCLALAFVATTPFALLTAQQSSTQTANANLIQGTVVDEAGKPVDGASVRLEQQGKLQPLETKSDSGGSFQFTAMNEGAYSIGAQKDGARSELVAVVLSRTAIQHNLVLILNSQPHSAPSASADSVSRAMEFTDNPTFTVAGVTDWTAVGGHGSDSSLRTSEGLARETLNLKPGASSAKDQPGDPNATAPNLAQQLEKAYREGGDSTALRTQVRGLLKQNDTADLNRLLGELDEKLGDPLAAVHEFERAVQLDPSERNYFEWGSELLLHRAVWQASEVFQKGTATYPKSARLLTALGAALFGAAKYDEAAAHLCDASDINPADPEPYLFMGKIQMAAPDPLACIESRLARFVQLEPNNADANYLYAMSILKRQELNPGKLALQQAEVLLQKAVTLDNKCADGYLQLGILSWSEHNYAQAIDLYTKALLANPKLGDAHYRLGVAYDRTGQHEKAKEQFELHDEIKQQQAAEIDRQRRDIKQFQVVLPGQPMQPPGQ